MKKSDKNMTFGEWLGYWFQTYKVPYLAANSIRNYEQMIRLHTPTWLKGIRLCALTCFDIDEALLEVNGGRTKVYAKQTWNAALKTAWRKGIIKDNPAERAEPIRYKKKHGGTLTRVEIEEFLAKLEGSRDKWLFLFYLNSGVRRNEALSIKWSDINYDEGVIYIRGTKTVSSNRVIPLTAALKEIIDCQRKQLEYEKKHPPRYKSNISGEYVFPFSPETVSKRFKKLCPKHHLHELRHTYITFCAQSGVNMNVCQRLVGHKTINTTLTIYTHVLDEFTREEAEKINFSMPLHTKKED